MNRLFYDKDNYEWEQSIIQSHYPQKSENREADRLERRYRKGSKSDKQYLRKRLSDMERRKLEERKARAQEQIAWNTIWH